MLGAGCILVAGGSWGGWTLRLPNGSQPAPTIVTQHRRVSAAMGGVW
jgi:hypothetical protein